MTYGMGTDGQEKRKPAGRKEMEIACECWFTSQGKMQSLMLKYRDDQGVIHTIKEIKVHSKAEINLISYPYMEFDVSVNCQGLYIRTKLVFYNLKSV